MKRTREARPVLAVDVCAYLSKRFKRLEDQVGREHPQQPGWTWDGQQIIGEALWRRHTAWIAMPSGTDAEALAKSLEGQRLLKIMLWAFAERGLAYLGDAGAEDEFLGKFAPNDGARLSWAAIDRMITQAIRIGWGPEIYTAWAKAKLGLGQEEAEAEEVTPEAPTEETEDLKWAAHELARTKAAEAAEAHKKAEQDRLDARKKNIGLAWEADFALGEGLPWFSDGDEVRLSWNCKADHEPDELIAVAKSKWLSIFDLGYDFGLPERAKLGTILAEGGAPALRAALPAASLDVLDDLATRMIQAKGLVAVKAVWPALAQGIVPEELLAEASRAYDLAVVARMHAASPQGRLERKVEDLTWFLSTPVEGVVGWLEKAKALQAGSRAFMGHLKASEGIEAACAAHAIEVIERELTGPGYYRPDLSGITRKEDPQEAEWRKRPMFRGHSGRNLLIEWSQWITGGAAKFKTTQHFREMQDAAERGFSEAVKRYGNPIHKFFFRLDFFQHCYKHDHGRNHAKPSDYLKQAHGLTKAEISRLGGVPAWDLEWEARAEDRRTSRLMHFADSQERMLSQLEAPLVPKLGIRVDSKDLRDDRKRFAFAKMAVRLQQKVLNNMEDGSPYASELDSLEELEKITA